MQIVAHCPLPHWLSAYTQLQICPQQTEAWALHWTTQLALKPLNAAQPILSLDFNQGALGYRQRHSTAKTEPVARAVGLRGRTGLRVLDATAGLGRDGLILARLGAEVTSIERHLGVYLLLLDAQRRAQDTHAEVMRRWTIVHADACSLLQQGVDADVVYLDPMYPARKRRAAVKGAMQTLHALFENQETDNNNADLLHCARHCGARRVVLKRPADLPCPNLSARTGEIQIGHTRYDIFSSAVTVAP